MPYESSVALSPRLNLPLADFAGGRGVGTIKTIGPGTFQGIDDRFPEGISDMLVLVDNGIVFHDDALVYI